MFGDYLCRKKTKNPKNYFLTLGFSIPGQTPWSLCNKRLHDCRKV